MLGVIGGMGPAATTLFYDMITKYTGAKTDQENIDMIILSHSSMPDRTAGILSGETVKVKELILKDCLMLQENGCDAVAVTCNTAHFYLDLIKDQVNIKIIHMINETVEYIEKNCPGAKIGLMSTRGTMETGLYQKALERKKIECYIPSEESKDKIMYLIYDCIKSGKPADMNIFNQVDIEMKDNGCDFVILGCTELSIIKRDEELGDRFIDPMIVLAKKCVEYEKNNN